MKTKEEIEEFRGWRTKDLINHINCFYNTDDMPWLNEEQVLKMKQELRDRKLNQLLNQ